MRPQKAVLVGPIQQENLALAYLAGSAEAAGHHAVIVPYSYRADLDEAVRATLAEDPALVGLGIAFQNNIDDYIAFLHELRARGFCGHVTAGGHVPTFCYEQLLRDVPGLDSVVRHDGEHTLLEMLGALGEGRPPRDIDGLVWRDGDEIVVGPTRRAIVDLDGLPWPKRGTASYSVGGLVVDFVLTARGCVGECNYCSIAAYTSEQRTPFRLRSPDAVADEIAELHRTRGSRVFFVQDDLFVLPSEKKSVERIARLRAALDARGVRDAVFWVKGRPETITPAVCRALRELGAIHMFLGVESANAARLDYLGRTHLPLHNDSAIAHCKQHEIVPSFNFMLFDPDCSLDDLSATLDMAERNLELPWNVCRTEVYSGTALRTRLEAEGRLEGDYRSYGYRMRDERAEVLFRILRVSLHERAFAIESLLNRLISLSFARQLHERYFPGPASDRLSSAAVELGIAVRRDTVRELRDALEFLRAANVRDAGLVRRFSVSRALEIGRRDAPWRARTEALWRQLGARGMVLSSRRGLRVATGQTVSDWGVAAGS